MGRLQALARRALAAVGLVTASAARAQAGRETAFRARFERRYRELLARYDAAQATGDNAKHWAAADCLSPNAANSPEVRAKLRNRARVGTGPRRNCCRRTRPPTRCSLVPTSAAQASPAPSVQGARAGLPKRPKPTKLRCMPSLVDSSPALQQVRRAHWRRVLWFSAALLLVWALVSLGCGVWFADELNGVTLGGFPLGFWFAQQGAIVVFVLLILVYAIGMNRLERRHRDELARVRTAAGAAEAAR